MNHSGRVETILRFINPLLPVWDLCCDHGLIGMRALDQLNVPGVVFVDKIAHIAKKIEVDSKFIPEIQVFTKDILELEIPKQDINFVIAGVGARLILEFLQGNEFSGGSRIIVGPHKNEAKVDTYLVDRFSTVEREAITVKGKKFWFFLAQF